MPHIDSPLQEPHPRHASATIVITEREYIPPMAGEARFSREMAAARGLHGDPAQVRRDSPDPGRRHDGRLHLAAIFPRRAGRRLLEVLLYTHTVLYSTVRAYSAQPMAWSYMHRVCQSSSPRRCMGGGILHSSRETAVHASRARYDTYSCARSGGGINWWDASQRASSKRGNAVQR